MKRFFLFAVFFLGIFAAAPAARAQVYDTTCPAGSSVAPNGTARNSTNDHLKQNYCVDATGAPIVNGPVTIIGPCSGSGCGSAGSPGTAFNVTSAPYSAVADGSTDNSTALASVFTASNAITSGIPTVYFPCQTGKQCQYNYGGTGVSPINPLVPTTIVCDMGVTLNYTGSAHAIDVGPTGLSAVQAFKLYRISGCGFTDSGSETDGIFVNAWIAYMEVDHNSFYNTPASASATAWAALFSGDGNNFWMNVHDNYYIVDNGMPSNFFKSAASTNLDSQLHFSHNLVGCVTAPVAGVGCSTAQAGVGVQANAVGSEISGNDINFMNPDIMLGPLSGGTIVSENNFEPPTTASGTAPVVQFGFSGDPGSTVIDGLRFTDNYEYGHGASPFLAPGSANDLLNNTQIKGLHFSGFSGTGPATQLVLNNLAGNTGNSVQGYECPAKDEGTGGALTCPPLHNFVASGLSTPPWKVLDTLNFSDGFNRANGALATPWVAYQGITSASITSNILGGVGAGSGNMLGVDFPNNSRQGIIFSVVPTGTDYIAIHFRATNGATFAVSNLYECAYISGTGIQLFKSITNTATQLGSTYSATTPVAGNSMEAEAINNTLTCYLNGVPVVSAVDSALTTGYPAILFGGTTGKVSSFTVRGLP
jgi:hypothetical protein